MVICRDPERTDRAGDEGFVEYRRACRAIPARSAPATAAASVTRRAPGSAARVLRADLRFPVRASARATASVRDARPALDGTPASAPDGDAADRTSTPDRGAPAPSHVYACAARRARARDRAPAAAALRPAP